MGHFQTPNYLKRLDMGDGEDGACHIPRDTKDGVDDYSHSKDQKIKVVTTALLQLVLFSGLELQIFKIICHKKKLNKSVP